MSSLHTDRPATCNATLYPSSDLAALSRREVARLRKASGDLHEVLHSCALAVLTSGSHSDDPRAAREQYPDFSIDIEQHDRGLRLVLRNAPAMAFVDGKIVRGVAELLFSVVRDLAYAAIELGSAQAAAIAEDELEVGEGLTEVVFDLLRNARMLRRTDPNLIVCWGGHSISSPEYTYAKEVGYRLGLRKLDICTGCGPGAMKAPMKGATIGHAKQRHHRPRYIGLTEPGIIAAESPNPIVNHLAILPDIEKRLEAFVRLGHGIVVFPGGVGTAEEILFILGVLLCPENQDLPFPLVLTGPASSRAYFDQIDQFIRQSLGEAAASRYQVVIDNPEEVARIMGEGMVRVREHRIRARDAFFFNWSLHIPYANQRPFIPTHENVAALRLYRDRPLADLAFDLRRAFSAIVAGNVKEEGVRLIERHGPYTLHADPHLAGLLDALLRAFIEQQRMKIAGTYVPCYRIVS